jgi:hypothetical protein
VVPYALSGYQWADVNVSASFMPDGTITDSGLPSNLFATLNAIAPTATWQREFARALQTWASVSPLNFRFVPDNGAAAGSSGSTQGDSRFGDIRLGGYVSELWSGYAYFPAGGTLGGDVFVNTGVSWQIGATPDLYSILLHETGHALGLEHTSVYPAVMRPSISTVYTGLFADDIAGIQAIYGARQPDAYDAGSGNDSFASATALALNGSGAVAVNADLTTLADVDYFRVTAPASFDGTLTVSVDARNLSLLSPRISVYDAAQNLLATVSASTYGTVATVTLTGLVGGQTYYLVADGATTDVFGMGAYQLTAQFGGVSPPPSLPSLTISNVSLTEGDSGSQLAVFTLTLSAASSNTVTVQYATADGTATAASDYVATSGSVTFAPGETQKTISVTVNGDTTYETDETFLVNLTNPSNATLSVSQGQGTIQNDDLGPDRYEVNDSVATATNFGKTNTVSQTALTLHTAADGDYFTFVPVKSGTFTLTVTPTQGSGTLALTVLNDQQTVVASGQSQAGGVTLTASLSGSRSYYVKVWSPSGNVFRYDLSIAKSSGGGRKGGGALVLPASESGAETEEPANFLSRALSPVAGVDMLPSPWAAAPAQQTAPGSRHGETISAAHGLPGSRGTQTAGDFVRGSSTDEGWRSTAWSSASGRAQQDWLGAVLGVEPGQDDLWGVTL